MIKSVVFVSVRTLRHPSGSSLLSALMGLRSVEVLRFLSLEGLNRKAAQADERVVARSRELMSENEGMPEEEARARALEEVHPDIDDRPIGEVIQTAHDLGARLELERARGGSGDGTRAYVTTRRRPDGTVAERVPVSRTQALQKRVNTSMSLRRSLRA